MPGIFRMMNSIDKQGAIMQRIVFPKSDKKIPKMLRIVMPNPDEFKKICKELIPDAEPKRDCLGGWYIDSYKLNNGLLMDIDFCPTEPYCLVPYDYDGSFSIHWGPEGAWSDKNHRKVKFVHTFKKFKTALKKVLKANA